MKIATDGTNIYNITNSGIDVYDLDYNSVGFIEVNDVLNSIYINLNNLYIGTTSSGVLIRKIDGSDDSLHAYFNNDNLPSDHILSVCVEEDYFNVLTTSGLDVYNGASLEYRYLRDDIVCSTQLRNSDFYFTTVSSIHDRTGSIIYSIDGGIINNMLANAEEDYNIIILATTSGAAFIKDDGEELEIYNIYTEV